MSGPGLDPASAALLEALRRGLGGPLPGPAAQERLMPSIRRRENFERPAWRRAAVLVLLYPGPGGLCFPLTRRREDLAHHPGQISLPGGSVEAEEGPAEAALRETAEELGVPPSRVEILGRLSPLKVPPSGFEIDPFVGFIAARPDFAPQESEVAELIEAPLSLLSSTEALCVEEWELRSGSSTVPFWQIGGHKIWGATAMILSELAALLPCEEGGAVKEGGSRWADSALTAPGRPI